MNIINFIKENKISVTLTRNNDIALTGNAIDHETPRYMHTKEAEDVKKNIEELTRELNTLIYEKYNLQGQVVQYTNRNTNEKGLLIKNKCIAKGILTTIVEKD